MSILDDDNIEEEGPIKLKFNDNFDNLRKDINTVELMLSSIQKHILVLEAQITSIEAAIKQATPADKGKFYQILNRAQELLSSYYDNFNRFSETKYKYRKEQDELNYKVVRLIEVELKSLKTNPSNMELLETLKGFQFENGQTKNKLQLELEEMNNDPTYEL